MGLEDLTLSEWFRMLRRTVVPIEPGSGSPRDFDVEYIYGFVGWGSAGKVDDVIPSRAVQDGGYALPWQRYDNNKMAAIHNLKNQ